MNVFAGAVVAAAAVGFIAGATVASRNAAVKYDRHIAADTEAAARASLEARTAEYEMALHSAEIATAYEKGKKDAEAKAEQVVADLRAGNLRLQRRWQGCPPRLPETPTPTSQPDDGAGDREESASRIVRAAAECDAQVRGLQELLKNAETTQAGK